MSYFQKKHRSSNSTFSNCVDESLASNCIQESLSINSNIFNKNANMQQNQKYKNNDNNVNKKDSSAISYLKNFKKSYCKSNRENIEFIDSIQNETSKGRNKNNFKKQYDNQINQMVGVKKRQSIPINRDQVQVNNIKRKQQIKMGKTDKQQNVKKISQNLYYNQLSQMIPYSSIRDQEDQSMEELLNSSINQFQRILEQQKEYQNKSNNLYEQNLCLKKTLTRFKSFLKQKLESGLNKQKQQLRAMLNEYVDLITKLLHDKEELSTHIEDLENQISLKSSQLSKFQKKIEEINRQKDDHINKTKFQIQEFLIIIEQFENQAKQQNQQYENMKRQVQRLKTIEQKFNQQHSKIYQSSKKHLSMDFQEHEKRIEIQSQKIQTLLELLQKSQQQTNTLKQILSKQNVQMNTMRKQLNYYKNSKTKSQDQKSMQGSQLQFSQQEVDQMRVYYEQKLQELQIQHEQQFIEYEKAIKQTINKKDQCIQRLNTIISQFRQGKKSGLRSLRQEEIRQGRGWRERNQQEMNEREVDIA